MFNRFAFRVLYELKLIRLSWFFATSKWIFVWTFSLFDFTVFIKHFTEFDLLWIEVSHFASMNDVSWWCLLSRRFQSLIKYNSPVKRTQDIFHLKTVNSCSSMHICSCLSCRTIWPPIEHSSNYSRKDSYPEVANLRQAINIHSEISIVVKK